MIERLLDADRDLRAIRPSIYSALSFEMQEKASYDSRATSYDRVVGSWLYNHLMWGASTASYRAFANRALSNEDGPLLDAGAGSAVFTAGLYAQAPRPLILVDQSIGMLEAARNRISKQARGQLPDTLMLLQANAADLPLEPESVNTVLSMALLHLIEDVVGLLTELFRILKPGGTLFATSLVTDRILGRPYLRLLHKAGEIAAPRTQRALEHLVAEAFGHTPELEREGNMAFLRVEKT